MSAVDEIFDYALDLAYSEYKGYHGYEENCDRLQGAIDICDRLDLLDGWDNLDMYDEAIHRYADYMCDRGFEFLGDKNEDDE